MILKGSARSGGQNLAAHLMNAHDNEHIELHEVRGFASDDLHGAFKEAQAISRATKCQKYLFSLSLSPPETENVPIDTFEEAIERIEAKLGLEGQPRAVVFHEKEGRRHAHCVWSRIDADTLTARELPYFKRKLNDIARDLYLENEWAMPRGFIDRHLRDPRNFTLEEWQQAKRSGQDPRLLKTAVQACWAASDSRAAFEHALNERGFLLAKGDRRGHVVVDHFGEVYSLARMAGVKAKDVRQRLGSPDTLRSVSEAKRDIATSVTQSLNWHLKDARETFSQRSRGLLAEKVEMTKAHRDARGRLQESHKERSAAEARARAERLPCGLKGLWQRVTGRYQQLRKANEADARRCMDRDRRERQELIAQHLAQRRVLQSRIKALRQYHAKTLLNLRSHFQDYARMGREDHTVPRRRLRRDR